VVEISGGASRPL